MVSMASFGFRFHMKVLCAICCGLILMIGVGGESLLEELDIHLDKTLLPNSIIPMA